MTEYLVYDVFSDKAFGGNQLAVFPDATTLPEQDLQSIAAEFNFSEVTFVYPPKDASNRARVRIFTPTMEVPFAGHPVIGTAVALSDIGEAGAMTLELGVGPLECHAEDGKARFSTSVPLKVEATPRVALVAQALSINEQDICMEVHAPTLAGVGLPFTITEVTSRDVLAKCKTNIEAFEEGAKAYPAGLDFAQFVYCKTDHGIAARMFAPLDNISEDPATGSACAALGALLRHITGTDQDLIIRQGEDMGRPSTIVLTATATQVVIAGAAKRVMQGQLVY